MVGSFFCFYLPPHRTRLGLRNMTRLHRWLLLGLVMLEVVVGMRASTTAHSLARWHAAVSRIPEEAVLPLGFGSKSAEANVAAFLGDKLLGSAIALAQYESNSAAQARGVGSLSELQGTATANRMLCEHLATILPDHADASILEMAAIQEHNAGTMVEAAVAAVHQQQEGEGAAAIAELASFLVERAREAVTFNYKGALLERGGQVRHSSREGADGGERFVAVAVLGEAEAEAEGGSIRESEREAARKVLAKSGVGLIGTPAKKRTLLEAPPASAAAGRRRYRGKGWVPVKLGEESAAANLANGESLLEWWRRSAQKPKKAFHRASMAARCFERVERVDAFRREAGEGSAALLVLCMRDARGAPVVQSFACTRPTRNQAFTVAALEANAAIEQVMAD